MSAANAVDTSVWLGFLSYKFNQRVKLLNKPVIFFLLIGNFAFGNLDNSLTNSSGISDRMTDLVRYFDERGQLFSKSSLVSSSTASTFGRNQPVEFFFPSHQIGSVFNNSFTPVRFSIPFPFDSFASEAKPIRSVVASKPPSNGETYDLKFIHVLLYLNFIALSSLFGYQLGRNSYSPNDQHEHK